jgi:hypothetical protein
MSYNTKQMNEYDILIDNNGGIGGYGGSSYGSGGSGSLGGGFSR